MKKAKYLTSIVGDHFERGELVVSDGHRLVMGRFQRTIIADPRRENNDYVKSEWEQRGWSKVYLTLHPHIEFHRPTKKIGITNHSNDPFWFTGTLYGGTPAELSDAIRQFEFWKEHAEQVVEYMYARVQTGNL